jgi:hypothetical protein
MREQPATAAAILTTPAADALRDRLAASPVVDA